jgi:hypothetical protein
MLNNREEELTEVNDDITVIKYFWKMLFSKNFLMQEREE